MIGFLKGLFAAASAFFSFMKDKQLVDLGAAKQQRDDLAASSRVRNLADSARGDGKLLDREQRFRD